MSGRLPAVTAREVLRGLGRAGYTVVRTSGSHYLLAHPSDPSRAVSVPFHGARSLKPGTVRSIIRQTGMTVDAFRKLL